MSVGITIIFFAAGRHVEADITWRTVSGFNQEPDELKGDIPCHGSISYRYLIESVVAITKYGGLRLPILFF